MNHEDRVARVAADVKARAERRSVHGGFVSLGKAAVSHFVPNPHDPRHADTKLDVRDLVEILDLDVTGCTCTAEPGLTFSALVRATLPHGLIPKLVPELETITLGGAVAGYAIESMSHKHGGFHDSCLELEVVSGTGEVLRCSRAENRDVFEMIHGSYGALGIITKLKFELIPAKPFVHMEYQRHESFESFNEQMQEQCAALDVDFVDAIVHSRDQFVLCLGRFIDAAPHTSSYTGSEIFYQSTLRLKEDFLTTYDYLFRYDTDCHWATRAIPGISTKIGRRLFGRLFLGSTKLLNWSRRLRPILKYQRHLPVVIDLLIPKRRFAEFYRWYEREIGYYPLWIVPYRMPVPYRWVSEEHRSDLYVDVAVYGLPNDIPGVNYSKLLEDQTFALGGVKTLISENHYDESTFWKIYDRTAYDDVKRRTDPGNLFRDVYQKFHFANPHVAPDATKIGKSVSLANPSL
jgi:FAD/FMN-containing dehydrogenase